MRCSTIYRGSYALKWHTCNPHAALIQQRKSLHEASQKLALSHVPEFTGGVSTPSLPPLFPIEPVPEPWVGVDTTPLQSIVPVATHSVQEEIVTDEVEMDESAEEAPPIARPLRSSRFPRYPVRATTSPGPQRLKRDRKRREPSSAGPIECSECHIKYTFFSSWTNHQRYKHSLVYPCDRCDYTTPSRANMLAHHARHFAADETPKPLAICHNCPKKYLSARMLARHRIECHTTPALEGGEEASEAEKISSEEDSASAWAEEVAPKETIRLYKNSASPYPVSIRSLPSLVSPFRTSNLQS